MFQFSPLITEPMKNSYVGHNYPICLICIRSWVHDWDSQSDVRWGNSPLKMLICSMLWGWGRQFLVSLPPCFCQRKEWWKRLSFPFPCLYMSFLGHRARGNGRKTPPSFPLVKTGGNQKLLLLRCSTPSVLSEQTLFKVNPSGVCLAARLIKHL